MNESWFTVNLHYSGTVCVGFNLRWFVFVGQNSRRPDAAVSCGLSGGDMWVEECRQHPPHDRQHGHRQLGPVHDGGQGFGQWTGCAICQPACRS